MTIQKKKKEAHRLWKKAIKMRQWYEDLIICCEDKSSMKKLEANEASWGKRANQYRANYLRLF